MGYQWLGMNMKWILIIALCLAGCATPYGRDAWWKPGGFNETQLGPDTYTIRFRGNGYSSRERTSDFVLLRAAQLAINGNYGWFAILQSNQDASHNTMGFVQTNTYWNGHGASSTSVPFLFNVEFPRNEILVKMFSRAPPPEALDAIFIYQSITQKYGLHL